MAIVVTTQNTKQAIYVQGHTHIIGEHGDLTITTADGQTIGVHNRNDWTTIQYGELTQPTPTEENK